MYIYGEEIYIFIENAEIFPTKKQIKEMGNDFVHLFSSFNRHLGNCSYCAVHSLHLAENCFGKTHKTMWRSFSNLPSLPHPHGQSISKACLSLIWNRSSSAASSAFHCPGPSHHSRSLDSAAASSPFSLLNPHPTVSVQQPEESFRNVNRNTSFFFPWQLEWKACGLPWLF